MEPILGELLGDGVGDLLDEGMIAVGEDCKHTLLGFIHPLYEG